VTAREYAQLVLVDACLDGSGLRLRAPGRTGAGREGTRRRAGLDRQLIPDSPAPGNMVRVGDPVEIVEAVESDGPPR
jgi:hypothetical protein